MWWLLLLAVGLGFFPLTSYLFGKSGDGGWLFSKAVGLLVSAWALWALTVAGVTPFRQMTALASIAVLAAANYAVPLIRRRRTGETAVPAFNTKLILLEEALFLGVMLLAVYVFGFRPEAYGTEKFMDYGFMTSMARSTKLPFEDIWLSGKTVNYYYGGQYLAAFLMKASGVGAGVSYTLMRALVTSMSFVLPFSLVYRMVEDRVTAERRVSAGNREPAAEDAVTAGDSEAADDPEPAVEEPAAAGERAAEDTETADDAEPAAETPAPVAPGPSVGRLPLAGGLLGGAAVAFAGNMHYVIFGVLAPIAARLKGSTYKYWFPNSTRYIGYDPNLPDKTIHEFPAYSSLLGDLHAHYVNLIFVVTVIAVAYAWARRREEKGPGKIPWIDPWILLMGLFIGIFQWTNAADFAIYYVVCGSILFFENLRLYRGRFFRFLAVMAGQAAVVFGAAWAAALPFTMTFVPFTSGVHLTHSHTLLWQLLILWGFPVLVLVGYAVKLFLRRKDGSMPLPDLAALLFGLCAAGLVLLPELVYVKDIYGDDHYRANTMFKLTYAAFVLFGIMMGYVLTTAFAGRRKSGRAGRAAAAAGVFLLILSCGYTVTGIRDWYGNVLNPFLREGTDASVFLYDRYPGDFGAVTWLNTNVSGQPVILEAPGDSYSDYERVSAATGLPTVAGWYVHEWLWRGSHELMDERLPDIEAVYTSGDEELVRSVIRKYGIRYVYVGEMERGKYPNLREDVLRRIGETVYEDEGAWIVKMSES